ncbi:HAMP domain-containing histidine kinase [Enterococcus faecalis]|nr:HAMP domain-containing histidine kinase [Enterococcus faecalis]EGO9344431.1 sensor histidine kinase [Enterococcus faecalis]
MTRNKEIQIVSLFSVSIIVVISLVLFQLSVIAGLISLIGMALILIAFFVFTKRRYKQIAELSLYLRQLSAGNFQLDLRDNSEGELSILKNEIYKVMNILSEQKNTLENEKGNLHDVILDISHQLKTPLTSIQMMVDLLENPTLSEKNRTEFLHNISSESNRMEWLVLTMLKVAQFDLGIVDMKIEETSINEILQSVNQAVSILLELKNIDLIIEDGKEVKLLCDINWTIEALINIVKNSIEHTPENKTITITYGTNPINTWIKISDQGKGLSREEMRNVFKRFYKGKNSGKNHFGIGLSLSLSILQRQNGTVTIDKNEENGAEFTAKFFNFNSITKMSPNNSL